MAQVEKVMADITPETGSKGVPQSPMEAKYNPRIVNGEVVVTSRTTGQDVVVTRAGGSLDDLFAGLGDQPAAADGGGGNRPPLSERNQTPEDRSVELEATPEYGRYLCEEIIRMRTTMSYTERYSGENGIYLRQLYKDLEKYVRKVLKVRHQKDPFNPRSAYEALKEAQKKNPRVKQPPKEIEERLLRGDPPTEEGAAGQVSRVGQPEARTPEEEAFFSSKTVEQHQKRITELTEKYDNDDTPESELVEVRKELLIYFREARRNGLLQAADSSLISFYRGHIQPGVTPEDQLVRDELQTLNLAVNDVVKARKIFKGIPEADRLKGIEKAYEIWAGQRMLLARTGQEVRSHLKEFLSFGQEKAEESGDTFWEPSSWTGYYIIKARTPEEFRIAADTFLQMIRRGSIGKSPEELFKHLQNFKEAFGTKGEQEVQLQEKRGDIPEEKKLTSEFMKELRLEFEALSYIFGADYSNETYNTKSYNQFMTAMALHEGPDRFVRLIRARQGQVGVFTQIFDREQIMEIFNNPTGEQEELNIIAGHFLQDSIKEMVIERGMGILLKDYDPRDTNPNSPFRLDGSKEADQKRAEYLKANLERIGIHMGDDEFRALFEGYDDGYANIRNLLRYGQLSQERLSQLPEDLQQLASQIRVQLSADQLQALPQSLKDSMVLGQVQLQIMRIRKEMREGIRVTDKTAAEILKEEDPEAYEIYKKVYERAEASFEVAFQLQGATGEKVRRGKGFLYADKNEHVRAYRKVQKDDDDDEDGLDYLSLSQKRERWTDSQWLGWMLVQISEGRKISSFSIEEQKFYKGEGTFIQDGIFKAVIPGLDGKINLRFTDKDREDICDAVPTYMVENFVQMAVMITKMKYANAPAALRARKVKEARLKAIEEVHARGFEARLWAEEFILLQNGGIAQRNGQTVNLDNIGYDRQGKTIALSFDSRGRPVGVEFDAQGAVVFDEQGRRIRYDNLNQNTLRPQMRIKRPLGGIDPITGMFKKFSVGQELGYNEAGGKVTLQVDNQTGRLVGINYDQEGNAVIYDKPKNQGGKRVYAHISQNSTTAVGENGCLIEETNATFRLAQSGDFRTRYTSHTYWGYQGNNRQTLIDEKIFAAAKRIRDGFSRPEDEDPLATQLLVVDPTLNRVCMFKDKFQEREVTLLQAAVEESLQDYNENRRKIYEAFLPVAGDRGKMRAGYKNEDWGGKMRFLIGFRELAAQQPARFSRRLAALIADAPVEIDSMGAIWGGSGVMGAIYGFSDLIKRYTHQGVVGQFGITKFIDQIDVGMDLYDALVGFVDPQTKQHVEGLYMKPTNNNEELHKFYSKALTDLFTNPSENIPYLYEFRKAFGRLERVIKLMRNLYSDIRNAGGALDLREVDIFLSDGRFNPAIEKNKKISNNTGTSRHSERIFYDIFMDWLLSPERGGGGDVYSDELVWNETMNKKVALMEALGEKSFKEGKSIKEWLWDKIGL